MQSPRRAQPPSNPRNQAILNDPKDRNRTTTRSPSKTRMPLYDGLRHGARRARRLGDPHQREKRESPLSGHQAANAGFAGAVRAATPPNGEESHSSRPH